MSKKVLILSGSPRRGGNSDTLCDEFMRGAEDTGNTVVKVFLGDYKINYCTGCGVCNGTHQCVQKDDMAEILDNNMMELTVEGFRGFTEVCLPNARERGIIYGTGAWQKGDINNSPAMVQAYEMGRGV